MDENAFLFSALRTGYPIRVDEEIIIFHSTSHAAGWITPLALGRRAGYPCIRALMAALRA